MAEEMLQESQGIWGWLRGGRPVQKLSLFLLLLFLLGAAVVQGYYFYLLYEGKSVVSPSPKVPPVNIAKEEARLQQEDKDFRQMMLYRKHSREYAGVILAISREPYRADLPAKSGSSSSGSSAQDLMVPEILPPYMTVRAIFIVGNEKTALMDIESEGAGIIVKEGHSFGGGLGRVLKISGNGVVVRWFKGKITIPLLQ
ncbi:MAG TPA: hypothetical protein PK364_13350 [Synergistaceae bacterium]|nr:hypothetical protein [Synergistaceae bacterium]